MKILFPTPVFWDGNDARYLARDGARYARSLDDRGIGALKVILDGGTVRTRPESRFLALGTPAEWNDPAYWAKFGADGALCYFGLDWRRLPTVFAMKEAGLKLALKMDAAFGVNGSFYDIPILIRKNYWFARHKCWTAGRKVGRLRALVAAAKVPASAAAKTLSGFGAKRLVPFLAEFDAVTAESPFAAAKTKSTLAKWGREDVAAKVSVLPHPVPDAFAERATGAGEKKRIVVAIAQDWGSPLKGGDLAVRACDEFLFGHPDWTAVFLGRDSVSLARFAVRCACRMDFRPPSAPDDLLPLYRESMILVTASGSEGAPNVVTEAVSCGCSVVYPPTLPQLGWTSDAGMGTMSRRRTPKSIAAALGAEAALWERQPNRYLAAAVPDFGATGCSKKLLRLLGLA